MNRILLLLCLWSVTLMFAQEEHHQVGETEINKLSDLFTRGEIEGHIRNYFMSTINDGDLKDYYTNALGGAIAFKTMRYKGFEAGVKGIFTYRTFSADLNEPDPTTGFVSLWEHQLYDITDLENFNDLDRLEELYLTYFFKQGYVSYGKLEIEDTPLLNESDGRMKPFAFNGGWLHLRNPRNRVNVSWLDRVSPRSTVEWYDFNEAIGLMSNGYQPDGSRAHYHEKTKSRGIALLDYIYYHKKVKVQYSHWYLDRIFNTGMLQLEYQPGSWIFGAQYALQIPDHYQKRLSYEERYFQPEERGQVLSAHAGWNFNGWVFGGAYTRAFGSGRFLFPRELGRDHFYTSIQRSRLDGFGDANIMTLQAGWDFHVPGLFLLAQYTDVNGPEIDRFTFNKYNLDAYRQLNVKLTWRGSAFLEGLTFDLLYFRRQNKNVHAPEVIFNRGDLDQFNLVVNYDF